MGVPPHGVGLCGTPVGRCCAPRLRRVPTIPHANIVTFTQQSPCRQHFSAATHKKIHKNLHNS
jgi:hypothetical protein